jgi:hypothetical protein
VTVLEEAWEYRNRLLLPRHNLGRMPAELC